jgi:tRNA threonylcarbamoyladenosine biosynthesis protein TsaB
MENQQLMLAIDTSQSEGSVALINQPSETMAIQVLAEEQMVGKQHAEHLLVAIETVLSRTQHKLADLTCLAVNVGPGSFTGGRVGVTTAKALSFALNIPLVAGDGLCVMAASHPSTDELLVPVLDARKNSVFLAVYHRLDGTKLPPTLATRDQAQELLAPWLDTAVFIGKDCGLLGTEFQRREQHAEDSDLPHARTLGLWAWEQMRHHKTVDAATLEPLYLRAPDISLPKKSLVMMVEQGTHPVVASPGKFS